MSLSIHNYLRPREWKTHVRDLATVSPLIAGVIAPLSVLIDIPALTEKWYAKNGTPQPDPKASLILSAVGLAFSVTANVLMIVRFSTTNQYTRITVMIPLSTAFWLTKVVVSLVNLILFGVLTRNQPSYSFLEGFWCAVISCITSAIVFFFLALHWAVELRSRKNRRKDDVHVNRQVRVSGRHFMLSTTFFLGLIAVAALVFSRIEKWTYLQGIYFFVVTFLTIGFGDFSPTHTSTQILLFPFALLGIAALGSLLDVIVRFFSARSAKRKAASRAKLEHARQEAEDAKQDPADLSREIEFLEHLNDRQDVWDQAIEFVLSFGGFLAFWFVGAAIFSSIEGWSYGYGLYFGYVFFLSIGYGDYAPTTPAGRVVFIVYSLLAVPIMAAFAVQAVTQVLTRISTWRLEKQRAKHGVATGTTAEDERTIEHAEYITREHARWEKQALERPATKPPSADSSSGSAISPSSASDAKERRLDEKEAQLGEEEDVVKEVEDANALLVRMLLERAVELELHARRLLIRHLPNGSRAQVLLKADRNVQLRDLRRLIRGAGADDRAAQDRARRHGQLDAEDLDAGGAGDENVLSEGERAAMRRRMAEKLGLGDAAAEDADWVSRPLGDEETMEEVRQYRECFAGLLVAGSRLQNLEGDEMLMLERRRERRQREAAESTAAKDSQPNQDTKTSKPDQEV